MDLNKLEEQLSQLPLYIYSFIDPKGIEFSQRIRWICEHECPMYGKSWACPPAVGEVDACKKRCVAYENCLLIGTIVEVGDIANIEESLATRGDHEAVTNEVRELMRAQGVEPYILSTEACAACDRYAYLDGEPWLAYQNYFELVGTKTSSRSPEVLHLEISEEYANGSYYIPQHYDSYKSATRRAAINSRLYQWVERFQELYPYQLTTVYEDDAFVCYMFRQNPARLLELAIMD